MKENENLKKQIADDLSAVLKEAKSMGCKEVTYFRHIPLQNVETVIQALEENQWYKTIGTIEEFKALKNKHIGKDNMVISSSDLMTILNSDSEELKSLKDENAYLHSELQAIGATADMFEKEIRAKAIDEFVGMLEFSLMNNYRHLLKIDMDEFEWLTTDSVLTHIRKVKEQLKGGAE